MYNLHHRARVQVLFPACQQHWDGQPHSPQQRYQRQHQLNLTYLVMHRAITRWGHLHWCILYRQRACRRGAVVAMTHRSCTVDVSER